MIKLTLVQKSRHKNIPIIVKLLIYTYYNADELNEFENCPKKDIKLLNKSRLMELVYDDHACRLSFEFLRIHSPSAEVKGHNPSQYTLQLNKVNVSIERVELVGSYAIRIIFDDGHETGLYSWEYLEHLVKNKKNCGMIIYMLFKKLDMIDKIGWRKNL